VLLPLPELTVSEKFLRMEQPRARMADGGLFDVSLIEPILKMYYCFIVFALEKVIILSMAFELV